ncbi:hypothetical protein ACJMK2_015423 [Sinanodonta woodiana]|uniref:Uncharacterized protein n=1 Tax=Sinanodonta woodiana TaxID=1069815 RepID=A0ABD3URN4_SINWO
MSQELRGKKDAGQMQPATTKADLKLSNNADINKTITDIPGESEGDCGNIVPGTVSTADNIIFIKSINLPSFVTAYKHGIIQAAKKGDYNKMKTILEEHTDLNLDCTDETGQAAIHYAASKEHTGTLRLLVENGAQLDLPDKTKGKTALHFAVILDQVKAVEYLVYAGAKMTIKDKEGKIPEQFAKSDKVKITLNNMKAATSYKCEALDARLETNKVYDGTKTLFKSLGLEVEYNNNRKGDFFTLICRRNTVENSEIEFCFMEQEEIVSDIFTYRITGKQSSLESIISFPLFCGPKEKEQVVIKTNNRNEFIVTDVKENTKKWTCRFSADLQKFKGFVAVCRPITEVFQVGSEATTLYSTVDKRVEISISENTFNEPTKITMEITDPPETIDRKTEEFKDITSATSFYTIVSEGGTPTKSINVKVPLPSKYSGSGSVVILSMDKDEDKENENSWSILDVGAEIIDDRVNFDVSSFSVKVCIESLYLTNTASDLAFKRQVSQLYRKSRKREHMVIFLMLMKRNGNTNTWNVVVECCHEDKAEERQKHWENESYEKQEEKSQDQIVALSKQRYRVKPNDAINVVGTHDVILEFHAKRDNFKQFIIEMNEEIPFVTGKLKIIQLSSRHGTVMEDVEKLLTNFTFKLEMIESADGVDPPSEFLDDNCMKKLMSKLEDEDGWFAVIILMGISFSEIEDGLATRGNLSNMLISMSLKWRDKNKQQEHLGVPVMISALAKGGAFALSRAFCGDLKNWYIKQHNRDDGFYKWVRKAYKNINVLNPGDYPCPMSDSYLAIISSRLEPSLTMASALQLTNEEHREVVSDKTYINDRLKAMKVFYLVQTLTY